MHDLIGLPVVSPEQKPLGTVHACHNFGAGDIIEIRKKDGKLEMYPFNEHTFPEVNLDTKKLVMHMPEELWVRPEDDNG